MVERPGQRVEPRRVDEGRRLAADRRLGGSEDEEEDHGRDERGRQGHDDDVPTEPVEPREHRDGVAPDADDHQGAIALPERDVLAEDEGRQTGQLRLRLVGGEKSDPRLAPDGGSEVRTGWVRGAGTTGQARCDDPTVRRSDLRAGDAALGNDAIERRVEPPLRGRV